MTFEAKKSYVHSCCCDFNLIRIEDYLEIVTGKTMDFDINFRHFMGIYTKTVPLTVNHTRDQFILSENRC